MSFALEGTSVTCEFIFKGVAVRPGSWLKMKNVYDPVLYQCLVTDDKNVTYAWCMHDGKWKAFNVAHIKAIIVPKRSFAKKCREQGKN